MTVDITRIGTGRPADITKLLTDPNSNFYQDEAVKNAKLTPQSELVQKLLVLAKGGTTIYPDNFNTRTQAELPITVEDLRGLGRAADTLALWIGVKDSEGKEVNLPPSEFNAWQGTVNAIGELGTTPAPDKPVDEWARERKVQLQDRGPTYAVSDLKRGGQEFHIESAVGSKRMVVSGRIMTRPYTINYGSENIIDADKTSPTFGHPIVIGNDGALDVNIPKETLKEIAAGKPYYGPVIVKMRMEDEARSDPKVFFLNNPQEVIRHEITSWQDDVTKVTTSDIAGVHFKEPISVQKSWLDSVEKEKTGYLPLSGAQYQAWKHGLSESKETRLKPVDTWIDETFGSREKFDAAFPQSAFPDGKQLPREAYHAVLYRANNPVALPLAISNADTNVAVWQEAMNRYAEKHENAPVEVDGAWGKDTQKLYQALGGEDSAVLNKLRKDGIELHPELFEGAPPAATPAGSIPAPVPAAAK